MGNTCVSWEKVPLEPSLGCHSCSKPPCPPAGTAWSCPEVRFTCALANPRNDCYTDRHCPRFKKCCKTFCGRRCIARPPTIPLSYGTVTSTATSGRWGLWWPWLWAGSSGCWGKPALSLSLSLSLPFPSVSCCSQHSPRVPVSPCHLQHRAPAEGPPAWGRGQLLAHTPRPPQLLCAIFSPSPFIPHCCYNK